MFKSLDVFLKVCSNLILLIDLSLISDLKIGSSSMIVYTILSGLGDIIPLFTVLMIGFSSKNSGSFNLIAEFLFVSF